MIKQIISLMNADAALMNLIGGTANDTHIYPIQTDYLGDCILYNIYTSALDKCVQQTRLELTIIASTIAKTIQIEQEVEALLLTLGDNPINSTILQVEVNGGGSLYDTARAKNHRIINFTIISRSEI